MAVAYKLTEEYLGLPDLSYASTTLPAPLGTIARGVDSSSAGYGEGEFQLVKFTGTVAKGDFVSIDSTAMTAVQASTGTVKGSVGIAMAAQVTGQYGWVMIRGTHDGANVATGVTAGTALGMSATPGRATSTGAGIKIDGAFERSITSAANVGTVEVKWPTNTGNG